MALITDPDLLADSALDNGSQPVFINTTTKRIKLNTTGALSTDGVTLKALYSFLKEEWLADPHTKNLAAFDFPMIPLGDESFEFVKGWDFENDTARYLIRTAGWLVRNVAGNITQIWSGIIGLGSVESNDQPYYDLGVGATNFQLQGQVNQAVQVYRDDDGDGNVAEGSDYNRRSAISLFIREQGQLIARATLAQIGFAELGPQAYRFPLSTGTDLKINVADTSIKASGTGYPADVAPYDGMTITYYATPQSKAVGGSNYNFGIVVNGNGQSLQEIYNFIQYALRQNVDIAAGATNVIGKTADPLAYYVGDTFYTQAATNPAGGGTGVFIENFDINDINSIVLVDNTGAQRTYPFVATLTLNFSPTLVDDPDAEYWVYFTTLPGAGNDFGESGAIIVDQNGGADMAGFVPGASVSLTFDYDGNTQGGRTAGTDANITVVALGKQSAQYVQATGTIQRSNNNSVTLVAALERNYANP